MNMKHPWLRSHAVLFPAISWGGGNSPPRIPNSPPPQKNTQNTKNVKKCIEFTPQICVFPPRTWSLELTLGRTDLHSALEVR